MPADAQPCPWCGAPLPPPRHMRYHVERCPACGVGVTRPWPTPEQLDAAYGTAYRPTGARFLGPLDRVLRRTRATLARRVDALAPPGPVLDVGAGDGTLLQAVHARGREVLGLERAAAGSDAHPPIVEADIEELPGGWAAIVFWHSLEHMPAPGRWLAAAAERLAPGGLLVVAVPNLASVQAQLFGPRWLALDLPRHLVHLSERALVSRLADLGLEVGRVSHWRGGQVAFGWLDGLVSAAPGHPSLYDALRRPGARLHEQPTTRRWTAVALAILCAPVALLAAVIEVTMRRGGSVHVEARRP
jgi:SAM-dependent methyltransferase